MVGLTGRELFSNVNATEAAAPDDNDPARQALQLLRHFVGTNGRAEGLSKMICRTSLHLRRLRLHNHRMTAKAETPLATITKPIARRMIS